MHRSGDFKVAWAGMIWSSRERPARGTHPNSNLENSMNKFHAVAAAAALAAGLLTATSSMASTAFDNKMSTVIKTVKADPNYKSIPLNSTADREWFFAQCEALYSKKITKEQFVAEGARQFPGYEASFSQLADQFAS